MEGYANMFDENWDFSKVSDFLSNLEIANQFTQSVAVKLIFFAVKWRHLAHDPEVVFSTLLISLA